MNISQINTQMWTSLEDSLTPVPKNSERNSFLHHLSSVFYAPMALSTLSLDSFYDLFKSRSFTVLEDPNKNFSSVLEDSRLWDKIKDLASFRLLNLKLWGVSTCTYQDSGFKNCPDSQWKVWEEKILPETNRSGKSADLFTLYQTKEGRQSVIDRLHLLSVNSYRFSIEWSHIEPKLGEFNPENLEVYVSLCKELRDQGISPMVTLHHFSEPRWFHELGSFEKEENIEHFASFVKKIAPKLVEEYKGNPLVEYICTINEPNVEALSRYILGSFSPGLTGNFTKAGQFLYNELKAHSLTYSILKALNPKVQVGIVYQRLSMIGANPLIGVFLRYINRLMNDSMLNFFSKKEFDYKIPFHCHLKEKVTQAPADFVGLQYYARPLIGFMGSTSQYEEMTEMPMREDPAGLYEAILETHKAFNIPIIITENGISTHNEAQRARYMERALYAVYRASEMIGSENILGYFLWSFCRNFEWDRGMDPQDFGAYNLLGDGRIESTPREGVAPFIRSFDLAEKARSA